ncbi:MAG: hypothetical protein JRN62_03330 [Nitrososphaerota archaeon]|jgi:hypothetical protein|nr:hypothetical protein [Nitrososphaerota archaeon]MDG6948630.1 hypothetical protein [Nitrososphaerota archaeon]
MTNYSHAVETMTLYVFSGVGIAMVGAMFYAFTIGVLWLQHGVGMALLLLGAGLVGAGLNKAHELSMAQEVRLAGTKKEGTKNTAPSNWR